MSDKSFLSDLSIEEVGSALKELDQPSYRARQIWQAFYTDLEDEINNFSTLPKDLRNSFFSLYNFSSIIPVNRLQSADGQTEKILFELTDKSKIETVLMRYDERQTLCISSQAGCAMGCVFCATGQMGFSRNLSSGEIVEQVLFFARELKTINKKVTNVVVMGMGEPFHNYDAVMKAIKRLNDPQGFNLGARRFTVSTVGLVPGIQRFAAEKSQINLAISLHAANNDLRAELLPIARKYPLDELMEACKSYIDETNRRVTFEWALIQGINDQPRDASELAGLLKGLLCHVNVIQLNPTKAYVGKATSQERALAFQDELKHNGIPCTIRLRRGIDIQAGCGQLATQQSSSTRPS
jgi:23S rRNA (adenine2503-C2)-methyltransferase